MCREKKSDTQISSDSSIIYSGHVARWLGVDPLADKYPDVSPYVYCEDNPLMYVDPGVFTEGPIPVLKKLL